MRTEVHQNTARVTVLFCLGSSFCLSGITEEESLKLIEDRNSDLM